MKFCFVSAPTLNDSYNNGTLPSVDLTRLPLGILTLASILEQKGLTPSVIDIDRLFVKWANEKDKNRTTENFALYAADSLAAIDTKFFGFSSICSSYPLTLRIITTLKQLRPDSFIILGGPQATASADATIKAFPSVDVIVRGEGDTILPDLLDKLASSGSLNTVLGISYMSAGQLVHNPDAPILDNLDLLPLPAFYLLPFIKEYIHRGDFLPLEVGRGCPFSCTYCSTNQFFRHNYRLKSPELIVKQMLTLHQTYGISNFELVHDNFTVNRKQMVAFCKALQRLEIKFNWSCSARTDCIDNELIDLMHESGCAGIFLGIESGSERIQKIVRKELDLETAKERIRRLNQNEIEVSASFIIGFPEETIEDLRMTVNCFVDLMRYDYVDPQVGLLSPLTGTPIHKRHQNELIYDNIISDMAFQGVEQDAEDKKLISEYPALFSSFYSVPTIWLDRTYISELEEFLLVSRYNLRWLFIAIQQTEGDVLRVFDKWRAWRAIHEKEHYQQRTYYAREGFWREFLRFVRSEIIGKNEGRSSSALLALTEKADVELNDLLADTPLGSTDKDMGFVEAHARPVVAPSVRVVHLNEDYARIINCLRKGKDLSKVRKRESTVVTKHATNRIETIQLTPESRELLLLCDGTREVIDIARIYSSRKRKIGKTSSGKACLVGLELLRQQGILIFCKEKRVNESGRHTYKAYELHRSSNNQEG